MRTRERGVEGGQAREHSVFPKGDMSRYPKSFEKRIPTTKSFVFGVIAKKATEASTWFKFIVFMRMLKNEAGIAKDFKVRVVGGNTM